MNVIKSFNSGEKNLSAGCHPETYASRKNELISRRPIIIKVTSWVNVYKEAHSKQVLCLGRVQGYHGQDKDSLVNLCHLCVSVPDLYS